jgi:hypothetical protein
MPTGVIVFSLLSCLVSLGLITAGLVMSTRKNKLQLLLILLTGMGIVLTLFVPLLQKFRAPLTDPADPMATLAAQSSFDDQTLTVQPTRAELQVAAAGIELELAEAAARGLVQFAVTGNDLANIKLTLESRRDDPIVVVIPAGAIFMAESANLQNMMVRTEQRVRLASPDRQASLTIPVVCVNMERQVPVASDRLRLSTAAAGGDLIKLVRLPDFQSQSFRIQQFAIWTITDNPARTEYVGISSFGVGSGPNDQEIQSIRSLFNQAGIESGKYRALR